MRRTSGSRKGVNRGRSKALTAELVCEIRMRAAQGETYVAIARSLGLKRQTVSQAGYGRRWGWLDIPGLPKVAPRPRSYPPGNGRRKLTWAQILDIRRRREEGEPRASIARLYNIHPGHVSHVALGTRTKRRSDDRVQVPDVPAVGVTEES